MCKQTREREKEGERRVALGPLGAQRAYQAPGTPGRRIQAAAQSKGTVWFEHQDIPVRCRIETLHGLSAHMDRDELLDWAGHIPNVKRIGLHHGEAEAQHALVEHAHARGVG